MTDFQRGVRICLLCFLAIFTAAISFGQIERGGFPEWDILADEIPTFRLPSIDRVALAAEDAVTDNFKEVPWRFGVEFAVDISTSEQGHWTLNENERVWRMRFDSPEALALSFYFDSFVVPKGAKLFVWNVDRTDFIGSFDHRNTKEWGSLAIGQTAGSSVIIEYHEPLDVAFEADLHIAQVVHAYRSVFRPNAVLQNRGPYGTSGACNINVNCPEGIPWATESKSVALILQGGFAACTGALVNNTAQDGTPYFLTANHCLGNPNNWIYLFNHEIENCTGNTNGAPTSDVVSGGTLRASNAGSDFALIELSEAPPTSYDVQYAGWDASGEPPATVTGIHHPSGDVKKICFDEDGPSAQNAAGAAVWYINQWEDGVTEPGSSGSPLFDQNHRVVGQLYGGSAACSGTVNNGQVDYYGRFDVSWDGASASTRLTDWLDPMDSGVEILDGWPEGAVAYDVDAGVQITGLPESVVCGIETVSAAVLLTNLGLNDLVSATIYYSFNGAAPQTLDWSGALAQFESESVDLPAFTVASGVNELEVWVENPNGIEDENAFNNASAGSFNSFSGPTLNYEMILTLDDYGSEVTWELREFGQVLYTGGPYSDDIDGTEVVVDWCLESGCYIFEISDSYGDGLCCEYGEGGWEILDPDGNTVGSGGEYTDTDQDTFCTESVGLVTMNGGEVPLIFPNPTQSQFSIDAKGWGGCEWSCVDATGRQMAFGTLDFGQTDVVTDSWARGVYFIVLKDAVQGSTSLPVFVQ
jgi:hypothetical protein